METIVETFKKLNLKPVKDFIKKEEEKQKAYKLARKNADCKMENGKVIWDPIPPSQAQSKAYWNSLELRIFYAAYALLRGKKLTDVEYNYDINDYRHLFNCRSAKIVKTLEAFEEMSKIKED